MPDTEHKPAVAVFAGPVYEEMEFWYPVLRFRALETQVHLLGIDGQETYFGRVRYPVVPDSTLEDAQGLLAAVVVPGMHGYQWGQLHEETAAFLRSARGQGAVVAATSSGVALLADAGLLDGVSVSCASDSIAARVLAAGAQVSPDRLTVSSGIVTARSVEDITAVMQHLTSDLLVTA